MMREVTPPRGKVALVATPTFAAAFRSSKNGLMVDYYGADVSGDMWSPALGGRCFAVDLMRKPRLGERYATVLMDPPWYEEHIPRFLHFAAAALGANGHLLMAMPAVGTRPSIAEENQRVLSVAEELGLELLSVSEGLIPYETPPFERSALRAAGIRNVAAEWRRGDLWLMRKVREEKAVWPGDVASENWQELRFGPVRVRVAPIFGPEGADPSLHSILEGDVLPTVSRRDSRRALARVWTTCNRIFSCEAPDLLPALFLSASGPSTIQSQGIAAEQHVRNQLSDIIEKERLELGWPCPRTADGEVGSRP